MMDASLIPFIFVSSVLRLTAAGDSIICAWTKVLPGREVHYSYIRTSSRTASPSLILYHTSWSGTRALPGCTWSDDIAVINDYLDLCKRPDFTFYGRLHINPDDKSLSRAEDRCVPLTSAGRRSVRSVNGRDGEDGRSEGRIHQRVKRSFIVPGTLWCGSGNKAPSYQDLGVFAETDSCCREHDHCKETILSFHSDFGLFNSNIFTMSHCDCDNKFHKCLKEAKDSISDVVGYTFFNLLKMNCFEFSHQLQCTKRNWFGMCKESKMDLYAVAHPPALYESPVPTELNSTDSITNMTSPEEDNNSTSHTQLFPITAEGEAVHTPSTGAPSGTATPAVAVPNTPEATTRPLPESRNNLENTFSTREPPLLCLNLTEKQLSCADYKVLDECKTKLLPKERRFGLHNPEAMTLYHCNCTTRLFQTLANQTQLTEVQALLLRHVSLSCFLLPHCTAERGCKAALVRAELPELNLRRSAEAGKQRHLQADSAQGRGPTSGRGQRKQGAVSLHKLCLRVQTKPNTRPENTLSMHTSPL